MKKIQITWDDLKDIPDEDFMAGRVAVTGLEGGDVPVTGLDFGNCYAPYLTVAPSDAIVYKGTFNALGLGLVREVEEHPHGLIPEEPWTHIVLGDGRHFVLGDQADTHPWLTSCDGSYDWWTHPSVQAFADEHGFEVLVPAITDSHGFEVLVPQSRVAEAREEGRLAGIREVADFVGPRTAAPARRLYPDAMDAIVLEFPSAFEAGEGD